jgi:hypothetical protein
MNKKWEAKTRRGKRKRRKRIRRRMAKMISNEKRKTTDDKKKTNLVFFFFLKRSNNSYLHIPMYTKGMGGNNGVTNLFFLVFKRTRKKIQLLSSFTPRH